MKIILTGATGYVGEGTLLELLKVDAVEKVLSVSRRPTGIRHEKLEEYLVKDFMQLKEGDSHFSGYDAVFFIAGITSVGTPRDVYVRISQEIPLHFADIMPDKERMTLIYLSGAGTTPDGKQFWQQVKGKTETDIQTKGYKRAFAFRPAIIYQGDGEFDTFLHFLFVEWEKRIRFAKEIDRYGKKGEGKASSSCSSQKREK